MPDDENTINIDQTTREDPVMIEVNRGADSLDLDLESGIDAETGEWHKTIDLN